MMPLAQEDWNAQGIIPIVASKQPDFRQAQTRQRPYGAVDLTRLLLLLLSQDIKFDVGYWNGYLMIVPLCSCSLLSEIPSGNKQNVSPYERAMRLPVVPSLNCRGCVPKRLYPVYEVDKPLVKEKAL